MTELRLGTRGSLLAVTQSRGVKRALEARGRVQVSLQVIRTRGDELQDRPLPEIGGKGLFTRELDRALLDGEIDLAVHSLKDLPTDMPEGLVLGALPEREDPRDVLIGPRDGPATLQGLPEGSRVGTGSLRRRALALAFRRDLRIENIRGNVDTRIEKVDRGDYDAILVAAAGVRRLGAEERVGEWMERTAWLPAPGQGALAVVTRHGNSRLLPHLEGLDHPPTRAAVTAERACLRVLEAGCRLPVGALGLPYDGGLRLWSLVASPDGRRLVRADRTGSASDPTALGTEVARILLERGADTILEAIPDSDLPVLSAP